MNTETAKKMIGKYVIVRANEAGIFAGTLIDKCGTEVVLSNCRRIWYWSGAASLSQLAIDGVQHPKQCKFSKAVEEICIMGVVEIIPTTTVAEKCIKEVWEWAVKI